jgi:2-methylisocitrate lyase-like PEP mutase family enzyme
VAALHIEDQIQGKRCGRLLSKEIVSRDIFYSRIQAAVDVRQEITTGYIGNRPHRLETKPSIDEALERLHHPAEIGADTVFPEALVSRDESAEVVRFMGKTPRLFNCFQGVQPELR